MGTCKQSGAPSQSQGRIGLVDRVGPQVSLCSPGQNWGISNRFIFAAQAVVTSWEAGGQAESEVHDPACNDTTLVIRLPHPTAAMVSIEGNRLPLGRSRRRVYGNVLLAGHAMGLSLCDLAIAVRRYCRAQLEVALSLERRRRIEATTFNLNAFSSQQSLSLFHFQPAHVGQLASLLDIDMPFPRTRLRVDPVECFCIVLRRFASPCRWMDFEQLFGRSGSALCTIFHATVPVVMARWGSLLSEWRVYFLRERAVTSYRMRSSSTASTTTCTATLRT